MRLTGLCSLFLLAATVVSNGAVERTNLGINGGRANYYAWDDVHQIMYTGVEAAFGLFKSADSGSSWALAFPTDSLEGLTNPNDGWSGECRIVRTDGGVTVAVVGGQKMIVTEDGGDSWHQLLTQTSLGSLAQTKGIMPPPQNASNACVRDDEIYLAAGCLILKTSDVGQNWDVLLFPDTTIRGQQPNQRMSVADVVPLSSDGMHMLALGTAPGSRVSSLWESFDGISFVRDTLIDSSTVKNPGDLPRRVAYFGQIITSPFDRSIVILTDTANSGGNISQAWISIDTGATWEALADGNGKILATVVNDPSPPKDTSRVDLGTMLLFDDPDYPNGVRIIAGLSYSDDLGATWWRYSNSNGPSLHGFRCHVPGTQIYTAFNEDAPYRCTDTTAWNWKYSALGMTAVQVNQIAQLPGNLDLIYLATNSGIAITRVYTDTSIHDPTMKWQAPNGAFPIQPFGGMATVNSITMSPYDDSTIIAGGGNGIWLTHNGGFNKNDWTQDNYRNPSKVGGLDGELFSSNGGNITSFAWYSPDTVLASISAGSGYGGLLISIDGGDSFFVWDAVPSKSCGKVYVADDSASGTHWIFAGYGNRTGTPAVPPMLWRSSNGGATWDSATVTGGSTNQGTNNMIYDIASGVGTVDTIFLACEYGVGVSTDTGATARIITFQPQPGPGPQQPMQLWEMCAATVDKANKHKVYLASRENIYLLDWTDSVNAGIKPYYSALPGEQIKDMLFDELTMSSSVGFFGLTGEVPTQVAYRVRSALSTHRILSVLGTCRGGIKVAYTTPASRAVTVSLLDMAGRTVQSITQRGVTAGAHTAVLRASQVARGVYAVSVRTDKGVLTRKFVLVR